MLHSQGSNPGVGRCSRLDTSEGTETSWKGAREEPPVSSLLQADGADRTAGRVVL